MALPKNLPSLLLAIWLILFGIVSAEFLHIGFPLGHDILAILALVTGILMLINRG